MKVCVLGGGSWGITIAALLHDNGHDVRIWEFNPDDAEVLRSTREHVTKLPGVILSNDILITSDVKKAAHDAEIVFFVVPSHTVRASSKLLGEISGRDFIAVNCAKGIENETFQRMSEVIASEMPALETGRIMTLSGPSHAEEVSRKVPTSVVIAGTSESISKEVQVILNNEYFRVYTSTDIVGVELGGSVKNIIAIAAGISHGLGFGDNTSGALITRGLAEIVRLGKSLGADPMTFSGLSGLGDLVTTCMSRHSRNRYVGEQIGKGQTLTEVLANMVMVAEGVKTTRSVFHFSRKLGVEMPITEQVHSILFEEKDPLMAVSDLMKRDLKPEM